MSEKITLPAAVVLTETRPPQAKDIYWASQCTMDMLPNYDDLRFPFKHSSLLCPLCGKELTGEPVETEKTVDPEEEAKKPKWKQRKDKQKKPKPWNIKVKNLVHEKAEDEKACPINKILAYPKGKHMLLTLILHQMTYLKRRNLGTTTKAKPEENSQFDPHNTPEELLLHNDPTLPKLSTSQNKEDQPTQESTDDAGQKLLF